jgi:hypothetical protein
MDRRKAGSFTPSILGAIYTMAPLGPLVLRDPRQGMGPGSHSVLLALHLPCQASQTAIIQSTQCHGGNAGRCP